MSHFTAKQYEVAIEHLRDALTQLVPNGNGCHVCGDSGHQAFECGWNPLVAVAICRAIAERADALHEELHVLEASGVVGNSDTGPDGAMLDRLHSFLHFLAGHDFRMGIQVGPAAIREQR